MTSKIKNILARLFDKCIPPESLLRFTLAKCFKNIPYKLCGSNMYAWCLNDKIHHNTEPAIVYTNGRQEWWLNGMQHRTDGPAVIQSDGGEEWWLHDKRHRTDGPAKNYSDGQSWYWHGRLHRTDGPAVLFDDKLEWYWYGMKISFDDWLELSPLDDEQKLLLKLQYG
jgi:hypothetical protein